MSLDLVFMGTPEFSVPVLDAVTAAGHTVRAVYCQPARPSGRGMAEAKSPVQKRAEALGLTVRTPVNFKAQADKAEFAALGADAAVVVAYGLLLPQDLLDATRLGAYNAHASKLPRWRGAAPIQRAIMAGDPLTAVNIMKMELGLDTGAVCLGRDVPIPPEMTAGELHDALSRVSAELMVDALSQLESGTLDSRPQAATGVTYASKIEKSEARIDFTRPARVVADHIRALSPWPGAWFEVQAEGKRERIKVLHARIAPGSGMPGTVLDDTMTIACGDGAIRLQQVQRAGRQPMVVSDLLRGFPIRAGTRMM